jgi:superfamily II DNA/RNA helicase
MTTISRGLCSRTRCWRRRTVSAFSGATTPSSATLFAGKSGIFLDSEWRSVEREQIKKAVKEHQIRMVVATDAACEGLNLQTLGTLINVDLPWNPSRLEQRIGRIKRFGQRRDRVDMLNLVYHGTRDEKVYETLSEGQHATVLQLPASPRPMKAAEGQKRGSLVK